MAMKVKVVKPSRLIDGRRPTDWRQDELFAEPASVVNGATLEQTVAASEIPQFTGQDFRWFLSGPPQTRNSSYRGTEFLYYGANDLERFSDRKRDGLPAELYKSMTKAEIAALFVGDGRFKYNPDANMPSIAQNQLALLPAEEAISILVGIGMGYAAVRKMRDPENDTYATKPGDMKSRLRALPKDVKGRVLSQLSRRRAVSSIMNNQVYDFPDTNAERKIDYTSAHNYIRGTINHLAAFHVH
jgi:hypothetical protein